MNDEQATGETLRVEDGVVRARPRILLPDVLAGTLAAVVTLSYAISYGMLIYSSPELQPHVADGLQAALMAAWVIALVVALGSSFHFSIAGPDSNATAILAVMAALIGEGLVASGASGAQVAISVLAMLAASAVLSGLLVYALGALRRGRLARFLPYPVVGGFLAGTGYLVLAGGCKVLLNQPLTWQSALLSAPLPGVAWVSAFAVALALLVLPRFWKHYLLVPSVLAAGVIVFYAGLWWTGLDIAAAREQGLLFDPLRPGEPRVPPLLSPALLHYVRWDALLSQWQNFVAMTIVMVITILLNATGLDLATGSDVDLDRELRVNGFANILSGLAGGMAGYISISRSLINFKAGAHTRGAGIVTALVCVCAAFLFTPVLSYFPRPVLAGLLIYLGVSMLREWVWDASFKLPPFEFGMIIVILLLITLHGLIAGVVFGLLVAAVFFVYSYSRTSCIKHSFSSATHFSNKERSLDQTARLKECGAAARTLALQGYLFFGTSSAIVETCRELIERDGIRYLLLDFRLVQGLDASAVLSFNKLQQVCRARRVRLLLSGLRSELETVLDQTKFLPQPDITVFPDADRGLEWIEDWLLEGDGVPADGSTAATASQTVILAEMDLRRILAKQFDKPALDVLIGCCQTLKLGAGTPLFRRGDPGDALYFIERGHVSVLLRLDDGQTKRLRAFGPGTIVGEMAIYSHQPRSADVVADTGCRVRKLSAQDLERLEREHPEVAVQFHRFVVRLLSARLAAANEEIRGLL
jgi:SulP family sulfate permease